MVRFIPHIEGWGNKTLKDLCLILETSTVSGSAVVAQFLDQASCSTPSTVWDIATLCITNRLSSSKRLRAAIDLLTTTAHIMDTAWKIGGITHFTSFNEVNFHLFMTDTLGMPFREILGPDQRSLGPLHYDTFLSGTAMSAVPAWALSAEIMEHSFRLGNAEAPGPGGLLLRQIRSATPVELRTDLLQSLDDQRPSAPPSSSHS